MIRIPTSTYRLQLTPEFTFDRAREILPYLKDLGISHVYTSPIFAACKGSNHGYDCVSMNDINGELGGKDGFERFSDEAKALGLCILQDIVPNHRAFSGDNKVLMDVLENGPRSRFYRFFDIAWEHQYENIRGRVLAPFLGDFFGRILERGELRLRFEERGFRVNYWDHSFPLRPRTYEKVLALNANELRSRLGTRNRTLVKYMGIVRFFRNAEHERNATEEFDPVPAVKELLWQMYKEEAEIRAHIDGNLERLNGTPDDAASFEPLLQILVDQFYRLSYWKVGTEELNYRRFFSINDLISLRLEDEDVYRFTHNLTFELVRSGRIHGLRLDHLDGLYNPTEYLERLRKDLPDAYIVGEKILDHGEELPSYWPIQGTSGYDFLIAVNGLFCDRTQEEGFTKLYADFTGMRTPYKDLVLDRKRLIIGKHMAGDIENLALLLKEVANRYRFGIDLTLYSLRRALVEIMAQFPIYRTYATENRFDDRDRELFRKVIDACIRSFPRLKNELDLIAHYLLEDDASITEADRARWNHFLMRLQQYTGPVMAKGVEDTAFYNYNRLSSLNDVGGNPEQFGITRAEFHEFNKRRLAEWPNTMSTTSTHDTKRGEDTRARINVLSEIPDEWREAITRWSEMNRRHKTTSGRVDHPSANDEYLFYQTLVGMLPFDGMDDSVRRRMRDYTLKAAKEAKMSTSWLNPNADYEKALLAFVDGCLAESDNPFIDDFLPFQKRVAFFGMLNSFSQALLKITCPGVPDIYQGCEGWDLTLVDPDNRNAVDYDFRRRALGEIETQMSGAPSAQSLLSTAEDGRFKVLLVSRALKLRAALPELFAKGTYEPIEAVGTRERNVVSFRRHAGNNSAIVVVSRLLAEVVKEKRFPLPDDVWSGTSLQFPDIEGRMKNVLTGQELTVQKDQPVALLLDGLPVALLVR